MTHSFAGTFSLGASLATPPTAAVPTASSSLSSMMVDSTTAAPMLPSALSSLSAEKSSLDSVFRANKLKEFNALLQTKNVPTAIKIVDTLLHYGVVIFAEANKDGAFEVTPKVEQKLLYHCTLPAMPGPGPAHAIVLLTECRGMLSAMPSNRDNYVNEEKMVMLAMSLLIQYCKRASAFVHDMFSVPVSSNSQPRVIAETAAFARYFFNVSSKNITDLTFPDVGYLQENHSSAITGVAQVVKALYSTPLGPQLLSSKFVTSAQLERLSRMSAKPPVVVDVTPVDLDAKFPRIFRVNLGDDTIALPLDGREYLLVLTQLDVVESHRVANLLRESGQLEVVKQKLAATQQGGANPVLFCAAGELLLDQDRSAAVMRAFLYVWLPLRHGFSFRTATRTFAPELYLPQMMCKSASSPALQTLLPLLSMPLYGVDAGGDVYTAPDGKSVLVSGTFMLFQSICEFTEVVMGVPDASKVPLTDLPHATTTAWAKAVLDAASPFPTTTAMAADPDTLSANLLLGIGAVESIVGGSAQLPAVISNSSSYVTTPLTGSAPTALDAVQAESLFEQMRAAVGDVHPNSVYKPLHGELGPAAAGSIRTTCGVGSSEPYLVVFMGYANARAPITLAAVDPNAVCVALPVSGTLTDSHTQVSHAAAQNTLRAMSSHVDGLARRVHFMDTGSVEHFHTRFNDLYRQARAAFSRAFPREYAPAAVVLVVNHYHAVFDYNLASNLYATWCEQMVNYAAVNAPDDLYLNRLRVWSTVRLRLSKPALEKLSNTPVALSAGVLPDETHVTSPVLSAIAWLSSSVPPAKVSSAFLPSATRAKTVDFATQMLQQTSDDTLRAWANLTSSAEKSTRIDVITATAGYYTVSLAASVADIFRAWESVSLSVVGEEAQSHVQTIMNDRLAPSVNLLTSTMAMASRTGEHQRAACELVLRQLAQTANKLVIADKLAPMTHLLHEALKKVGVAVSPEPLSGESMEWSPPPLSLLSSSTTTAPPPPSSSSSSSSAFDKILELAPEKLRTSDGRQQIAQIMITQGLHQGLRDEEVEKLRNPVLDIDMINIGINHIRGMKMGQDGDENCLTVLARWMSKLAALFLAAGNDNKNALERLELLASVESVDNKPLADAVRAASNDLYQETANVHTCLETLVKYATDEMITKNGFAALAPAMVYMQMISNTLKSLFMKMSSTMTRKSFGGHVMAAESNMFEYIAAEQSISIANIARLQQLMFISQSWILPFTAGVSTQLGGDMMPEPADIIVGYMHKLDIMADEQKRLFTASPVEPKPTGRRKATPKSAKEVDIQRGLAAIKDTQTRMTRETSTYRSSMLAMLEREAGSDKRRQFALTVAQFAMQQVADSPLLPFDTPPLGFMCSEIRLRQDTVGSVKTDPKAIEMSTLVSTILTEIYEKLGAMDRQKISSVFAAAAGVLVNHAAYGYVFNGFEGAIKELNDFQQSIVEFESTGEQYKIDDTDDPRLAFESTVRASLSRVGSQYALARPILTDDIRMFDGLKLHPSVLGYIKEMYNGRKPWTIVELMGVDGTSMNAFLVPPSNPRKDDMLDLDSAEAPNEEEDASDDDDASSASSSSSPTPTPIEEKMTRNYQIYDVENSPIHLNTVVFSGNQTETLVLYREREGTDGAINPKATVDFFSKFELNGLTAIARSILETRNATVFTQSMREGALHPAVAVFALDMLSQQIAMPSPSVNNVFSSNTLNVDHRDGETLFEKLHKWRKESDSIKDFDLRIDETIEWIFGRIDEAGLTGNNNIFDKLFELYSHAGQNNPLVSSMIHGSYLAVWRMILQIHDNDVDFFRTFIYYAEQYGFATTEEVENGKVDGTFRRASPSNVVRTYVLYLLFPVTVTEKDTDEDIRKKVEDATAQALAMEEQDYYAFVAGKLSGPHADKFKSAIPTTLQQLLNSIQVSDNKILTDVGLDWLNNTSQELLQHDDELSAEIDRQNKISERIRIWIKSASKSKETALQLWRKALRNAANAMKPDVCGVFLPRYITARYAGWTTRIASSLVASPFAGPVDIKATFLKMLISGVFRSFAKSATDATLRAMLDISNTETPKTLLELLKKISPDNLTAVARALVQTLPSVAFVGQKLSEDMASAYVQSTAAFTSMIRPSTTQGTFRPTFAESRIAVLRRDLGEAEELKMAQLELKALIRGGQLFITDELVKLTVPEQDRRTLDNVGPRALVQFSSLFPSDGSKYANLLNSVVTWCTFTQTIEFADVITFYKDLAAADTQEEAFDTVGKFLLTDARLGYFIPVEIDKNEIILGEDIRDEEKESLPQFQ